MHNIKDMIMSLFQFQMNSKKFNKIGKTVSNPLPVWWWHAGIGTILNCFIKPITKRKWCLAGMPSASTLFNGQDRKVVVQIALVGGCGVRCDDSGDYVPGVLDTQSSILNTLFRWVSFGVGNYLVRNSGCSLIGCDLQYTMTVSRACVCKRSLKSIFLRVSNGWKVR